MLALTRRNSLLDLFDDLHNDRWFSNRTLTPLADVHSDAEKVTVEMEVPGISPEDVEISLNDNVLTIKGEKKYEKKSKGDYERVERYYGSFTRSFSLPSTVDPEKIEAKSVDGVLKITIPKQEKVLPRKIKVLPGK